MKYCRKEMRLLSITIVILSCLLNLCQTQTYRYPRQRTGDSYGVPAASTNPFYNSASNPSYHKRPYSSSTEINSYYKSSPSSNPFYNKQYLSNSFKTENLKENTLSKLSLEHNDRVSKADADNAKFIGSKNHESDDIGRSAHLKRKKFHRWFGGILKNPCSPYGRGAGTRIPAAYKEQGRFLWDINVYNVYPQTPIGSGCGYSGGFGTGLLGGLSPVLSDPIDSAYYPPGAGIANFLGLFAPGILQNSLPAPARPQQFSDYSQLPNNNYSENDPEVDPNYKPEMDPFPIRRPTNVLYDSIGAPPLTPAQIVGGISTTVNSFIQQLAGNSRPVYG